MVKTSAGEELLSAIDAGRSGQTYVSAAADDDYRAMLEKEKAGGRSTPITPRQTEVLKLLAMGLSAKEIASQLDISTRTVEAHKYRMMEALGFKTTAQLIHYTIKNGLV